MAVPDLLVQVAFASNPLETPVWTDISAYVDDYTFKAQHGRIDETQDFQDGRVEELLLDNTDRRFDPTNTASPYYPNVVRYRRIRITETWAAVPYVVFDGHVERWPQNWEYPEESVVPITAVDASLPLSKKRLAATAHEQQARFLGATHWHRFEEETGTTAYDSIGSAHGVYTGGITQGAVSALPMEPDGKAVSFTETVFTAKRVQFDPLVDLAGEWSVSLWLDTTLQFYMPLVSQWDGTRWLYTRIGAGLGEITVDYGLAASLTNYAYNGTPNLGDGDRHHLLIAWDGSAMTIHVDGGPSTVVVGGTAPLNFTPVRGTVLGQVPGLNPGLGDTGTLDELMVFDRALTASEVADLHQAGRDAFEGDLSGARVNRVLDWAGWPAADRAVDAGQSVLQAYAGAGSALDHMKKVEETENGRLFVSYDGKVVFQDRHTPLLPPYNASIATFGDSTAEANHYTDLVPDTDQPIRNRVRFSSQGQTAVEVFDQASIDRYFEHYYERSGLLTNDQAELRGGAEFVLGRYKDDALRFEAMVLEPYGAEDTLYPLMLGLSVGDRITVVARPPGGGDPIQLDVIVEGRVYEASGQQRKATFRLSPAEAHIFWVLGRAGFSELGTATRLSY